MAVKDGDIPNRARIWAVVLELASEGRHFTRVRVRDITGLRFSIIDDHFNRFLEDEKIQRIGSGVYEMVRQFEPDPAISLTEMEDGRVKIEAGDVVLPLNPTGVRKLSRILAGYATQAARQDLERELIHVVNRLDAKVARNDKRLSTVARQVGVARKRTSNLEAV